TKQTNDSHTQVLRICAEGMLNGSAAAIRQADQVSGVQPRQQMLASAAQTLLVVRQYALAADLFEAPNQTANAPALANMIQILKKTRRLEDQDGTIRRPEDALRIFLARLFNFEHDPNGWRAPLSSLLLEEEDIDDVTSMKTAMTAALAKLKSSGLTLETA